MSQSAWDRHYANFKNPSWASKPSLFALTASEYFAPEGRILELGAGCGQDTEYFAEKGYEVVSTDCSNAALEVSWERMPDNLKSSITCQQLDMNLGLPFADNSFDAVYAHLSIHYFDRQTTMRIIDEVRRLLKNGGTFAFLVNSTSDPDYGKGPRLEDDYFLIGQSKKRYFSVESVKKLVMGFQTLLLDDLGESYSKSDDGVHNLIRFIGRQSGGGRAKDREVEEA